MKKNKTISETHRKTNRLNLIKEGHKAWQMMQQRALGKAIATDRAIRSHPYFSLGAALGTGALIAYMLRPKSKDNA
ncbi:MAG TPA: DUF883 C-terminal domain-containing protein [Verrucomicrobiae bacterium]|jgi:ElaB/YqjD/DUF883 family membrane-anchored ribosome-binding protein